MDLMVRPTTFLRFIFHYFDHFLSILPVYHFPEVPMEEGVGYPGVGVKRWL